MNKLIATIFALLLMIPLQVLADAEGDSFAEATNIPLFSAFDGAIDVEGDADFFLIELPNDGKLIIFTTGNLDVIGNLYDANGGLIKSTSSSNCSNCGDYIDSELRTDLTAGDYYLEVKQERASNIGEYKVFAQFESDDAKFLQLDIPITEGLSSAETDVYSFTLDDDETVTFWTTGETDTYAELYDADNNVLENSRFNAENGNFVIQTSLSAGSYKLAITGEGGAVGNYTLNVSNTTPDILLTVDATDDYYSVYESNSFSEISPELGFMDVADISQLTYVWSQLSGPEVIFDESSDKKLQFTAPALHGKNAELLRFQLTVTDPVSGAEASDIVIIPLLDLPNDPIPDTALSFDKTVEAYLYVFDVTGTSPTPSYDRDRDFHKIVLDKPASLDISVISLNGQFPLIGTLYNENLDTVASDLNTSSSSFKFQENFLPAGTYYLYIGASSSSFEPGGAYSLEVTRGEPELNSGDITVNITANFPDLSDGQSFYDLGFDVNWFLSATNDQPNFDLCNTVSGSDFVATSNDFFRTYTRTVRDGCQYDIRLTIKSPTNSETDLPGSFTASVNSLGVVVLTQTSGENDGLSVFDDEVTFGGGVTFDFGTLSLLVNEQLSGNVNDLDLADYSLLTLSYKNENFSNIGASDISGSLITDGDYISIPLPAVGGGYEYTLSYAAKDNKRFKDLTGTFSISNDNPVYTNDTLTFAPNKPPVANAGNDQNVNAGASVTLNASQSMDMDGTIAGYSWQQISGQTVTLNNATAQSATFTAPATDTSMVLTFGVTVTDDVGSVSTDTVQVTVNQAPVANAGIDQVVDEGTTVTLNGGLSSDPENKPLTYNWQQTAGTSVDLSGEDNVTATFIAPETDLQATLMFSLIVTDDAGLVSVADSVSIVVNHKNKIPTISGTPTSQIDEDSLYTFIPVINDDSDGYVVSAAKLPAWLLLDESTGKLSGTPLNDDVGDYPGIVMTVTDKDGESASLATFSITVINVNDAPTTAAGSATTTEDAPIEIVLSAEDIDNDQLEYSIETDPVSGVLSEIVAGKVTYTPTSNFNGNDSFVFKVSDGIAESNLSTVSIVVKADNDVPVVMDTALSTPEDVALNIELLATDSDDDDLTFNIVQNPSSGTLSTLDGNKTVYTPNLDFFGSDSFSYKVNDGITDSNIATVTIEVSSVNDAPIITSSPIEAVRATQLFSYKLTASDVDGEILSFSAKTIPSWLTLVNGVLSGTPTAADIGENAVVIELSDDGNPKETVTQSFTVVVSEYVRIALEVTAPPDIMLEASGPLTAVELGEPEIKSEDDTKVTVSVDQTGPFAVGEYLLVWTATEEGENIITASQKVTIKDTTAPLIDIPDLIEIEATGEFTDITSKLNLPATDLVDGNVDVELISNNLQKSGMQQIMVRATDSHGNQAEQLVQVAIHPQVMLGMDQVAENGANVSIPLQLNGAAAILPVTINYQIDSAGQVNEGEFVIDSELAEPLVITLPDDLLAGDQVTVKLISAQNAVLSSDSTMLITLIETNVAPRLKVDLYQSDVIVSIVDQTSGAIELKASVLDLNMADVHSIVWLDSNANELGVGPTLTLDPMALSAGTNTILVKVNETNTNEAYSNAIEKVFWVVDSLPLLTDSDTDGDGISDIAEGYADQDGDGIPDFKDATQSTNELPVSGGIRKLQAPVGIQLSLGTIVQQKAGGLANSASLTQEELIAMYGVLAMDEDYSTALPLIDFVASGLNQQGGSVTLIIALAEGNVLPENAGYRKFNAITGWRDFVSDAANSIASALTDAQGNCPSFDSGLYVEGLTAGDQCIALTIQDGSANDDDAMANAIVTDPGAIVVELPNLPAQIIVSGNESVNEGGVLTLDASASTDPEGKSLTYMWQQLTGPVASLQASNTAVLKVTAPNVDVDEQIELQLTVSDGKNSSIWTKVITIVFVNQLPELSLSASASSVVEKESVTLTATATDADGQNLSYTWEQTSGPTVNLGAANTAQLSFTMPEVDANSKLVFKVSVFDGNDPVVQYINLIVVNQEGGALNPLTILILILILMYGLAISVQTRSNRQFLK